MERLLLGIAIAAGVVLIILGYAIYVIEDRGAPCRPGTYRVSVYNSGSTVCVVGTDRR